MENNTQRDGSNRFSQNHKTFNTSGNYNNDIGMPLMILDMNNTAEYAVLEMGASKPGDIKYLVDVAYPDIVLINNAAPAHLDGFKSINGVADAKGEILQGKVTPKSSQITMIHFTIYGLKWPQIQKL